MGYSVNRKILTFESGFTAWRHLQKDNSADIVLFDANIPEINGFELLSRIKQTQPDTTCILMSSNPDDEETARAFKADGFLAKPFSVNDLFNTVQTFIIDAAAR